MRDLHHRGLRRPLRRSIQVDVAGAAVALILGAGVLVATPERAPTQATAGPAFAFELPNLPGQRITGVVVEYAPGARSPAHHHTTEGSVVGYVLEGSVRSRVDDGPVTVYRAGESWIEPPGAAHSVSENASATEPARLLAIFVADAGAQLTTIDP